MAFIFDNYKFDKNTNILSMAYKYSDGHEFVETIEFPKPNRDLSDIEKKALDKSFKLIFLLAGVSYLKAFLHDSIVSNLNIDTETSELIKKTYLNGLGEFSYINKVDIRNKVNIPNDNNFILEDADDLNLSDNVLIPVGGGKDSVVTIETLKKAGKNITLFVLTSPSGIAEPIKDCIDKSELPFIKVIRTLSPEIIKANKEGAYNGHVPITSILSAIAIATAIINGDGAVILSNENSANEPNMCYNGLDINHQYSKSIEFERDLSVYINKYIATDLKYFSFLRPLSELAIIKRFVELKKYHHIFRSCNKAFKQQGSERLSYWCCDCPKCRFIFLCLAAFMSQEKLISIFGKNILDDKTQLEGFAELCGFREHKPFECVGQIEECQALMNKLSKLDEWKKAYIVKELSTKIDNISEDSYNKLFELSNEHLLTDEYLELL